MKRLTKSVLGGVAGCALILGATQAANGASSVQDYDEHLVDYQPTVTSPFDGASATLQVTYSPDVTGFKLSVRDIASSAAGTEFGAHLHVGRCELGTFAGGHYNHDAALIDPTVEISRRTEVWFDLVPSAHNEVTYSTKVAFTPIDSDPVFEPGVMSIVFHERYTDHKTGIAGGRLACMPLDDVSKWAKTTL